MSPTKHGRPPIRWVKGLGAVGLVGLMALASGYYLTSEPAPEIRILWRSGLPTERRAELEDRFRLVNRKVYDDRFSYDLLDTRPANVRLIVGERDIADTDRVDREGATIPPNIQRGESRMWLAHRMPGLRDARVQWTLIVVLATMVIIAFGATIIRWPGAMWRWFRDCDDAFEPRADRDGSGSAQPITTLTPFLTKIVVGALLVTVIGVPILEAWETLLLAVCVMALIFGVPTPDLRRLGIAAAVVIAVLGMKAALPRADIAEGHNVFLVLNDGEPPEQGLPPSVFRSWKAQLEALYPPEVPPYTPESWRADAHWPESLFATSADAIWREPKYTRQVDTIDFQTLGQFRGGFTNETRYSFYDCRLNNAIPQPCRETGSDDRASQRNDLDRQHLPFFVMYELTPASVGSSLAWKGQAFWEQSRRPPRIE